MRAGPKAVAESILTDFPLDGPPEVLEDVVCRIIEKHPEWSCRAADKAPLWSPKVENVLQEFLKRYLHEGKQPRFAFNSVSTYKIQGACFIEPRDSPEVKEQKSRRLHWCDYHGGLCSLTPRQFEMLCSKILSLLGVPKPHLTRYRDDQGIDFFGRLSIGDLTGHGPVFPVFESTLIVWLVGQAKHYLHAKVATPDIRGLVGSTSLARTQTFAKPDVLSDLKMRICDPVIMLFFTTGQISTDGWYLCRRSGIAAMDGEMVAAFLADKQVGMRSGAQESEFDIDLFVQWLEGNPDNG